MRRDGPIIVAIAGGSASGKTTKELLDLAEALEKSTLFDKKDILDATGALLTFKVVAGDAFDRTLKVAIDLAEVMGTDVKSAAMQLGKALEDPAHGLTALTRSGVSFSQQQKDLIKTLVETGQEAKALDLILKTVEGQVAGASTRAAEGLAGSWKKVSDSFGDLKEQIGQEVAESSIPALLRAVGRAIDFVTERGQAARGPLGEYLNQMRDLRGLLQFVARYSADPAARRRTMR